MLKSYRTNYGRIYANTENAISTIQECKATGGLVPVVPKSIVESATFCKAKTYKTENVTHRQTAIGRVRSMVARLYSFDHATTGAIARQILKQTRFTRLDVDNSETHLAFSPEGVNSRDIKRRRSLTIGKYLRRKCEKLCRGRLALTDTQVEKAGFYFASCPKFPLSLAIVTGDDAFDVYDMGENGISSCMSGTRSKSKIVEHHFKANPDVLSLVVAYHSSGDLAIRSKLYQNDDGTHFLDRIYWSRSSPVSDTNENELREWLTSYLVGQGKTLSDTYDITLTHELGEPMPYLDRADNFDRTDDDCIHLHKHGEHCADNTDGTDPSDGPQFVCACCNCRIDEDDMRTSESGDDYCESCYNDAYSWDEFNDCEIDASDAVECYRRGRRSTGYTHQDGTVEVSGDDTRYLEDDERIVEVDGEWYRRDDDDVCYCADGEYRLSDDCVCCEDGEYREECDCVKVDGEWYAEDDERIVTDIDGEQRLSADCVEVDGEWYPEDDARIDDAIVDSQIMQLA